VTLFQPEPVTVGAPGGSVVGVVSPEPRPNVCPLCGGATRPPRGQLYQDLTDTELARAARKMSNPKAIEGPAASSPANIGALLTELAYRLERS
jgi:hypothetical protein